MVDVEGGNNLLYLPLDKIMEENKRKVMMMSKRVLYTVFGVLSFLLIYGSFFVVNEKERAIVFNLVRQ